MKHTPGPWVIDNSSIQSTDHGKYYLVGRAHNDRFTDECNAANLCLIAAAPDLLAALADMVKIWEGPRERAAVKFAAAVVNARAAIAKATGQS